MNVYRARVVDRPRRRSERSARARAGRSPTRRARQMQVDLLSQIRWRLAALAVLALVITVPVLVFSGNTLIAFAVGMLDATLAWGVALFVIESTGSSTWRMGAQGERWTAEELAGLDDRWRTLHAIGIPFGDVDHVAIGPAGVYALETKWTSGAWRRQDLAKGGRLDRAADQVWENRRAVRSRLRGHFRAVPVSPVIVLWGKVEDGVVRPHGEVQIVHGSELRSWLSSQPDVFDRETVGHRRCGRSIGLPRVAPGQHRGAVAVRGGRR